MKSLAALLALGQSFFFREPASNIANNHTIINVYLPGLPIKPHVVTDVLPVR
jgi:hypothetical protein